MGVVSLNQQHEQVPAHSKLNQNFKHKPSLRYIHIKRQKKQSSRPLTKETLHRNLSKILAGLSGQLYAEYSLSLLGSRRNKPEQRHNAGFLEYAVVSSKQQGNKRQHLALPTSIQYEKINNI